MENRRKQAAGVLIAVVVGILLAFQFAIGPLIADFFPPQAYLFVGGMVLIVYGLAGLLLELAFSLRPWVAGLAVSLPVLLMVVPALLGGDRRGVVLLYLILPASAAALSAFLGAWAWRKLRAKKRET